MGMPGQPIDSVSREEFDMIVNALKEDITQVRLSLVNLEARVCHLEEGFKELKGYMLTLIALVIGSIAVPIFLDLMNKAP